MNPIDEILYALIAMCVLAMAHVTRPTYARCPDGWYVAEGAPLSGVSACQPDLPEHSPCAGYGPCELEIDTRPSIPIQIFCESPSRPVIVQKWQAIACRT